MPRRKFSEMLQDWPMNGRQGGKRAARLEELRKSRSITQVRMAEYLRTNQGEISRIERRTDIYISTLAEYIRALSGRLEIRAVSPIPKSVSLNSRKSDSFPTWSDGAREFLRDSQDNVDNPDCSSFREKQ